MGFKKYASLTVFIAVIAVMTSLFSLVSLSASDAPVIMSFEGEEKLSANAVLYRHDGKTEGKYELVKAADGTDCLRLDYLDYTNFSEYRCMPKFKSKDTVTSAHKYVRVTYMTEDVIPATITLRNNAINKAVTLAGNTSMSQGKWVRSNAVNIDEYELLNRFVNGIHCTLEYNTDSQTGNLFIKEIGFFTSEEQAYEYYGDEKSAEDVAFSVMTFGASGNGATLDGPTFGNYSVNSDSATLDIVYAEKTSSIFYNYMAKIKFSSKWDTSPENRYVRVLYAADMKGTCTMRLFNDKVPSENIEVDPNVKDTDGKYVLTPTVYIPDDMTNRFSSVVDYQAPTHNSLVLDHKGDEATFSVKAVYFFPTKESADAFVVSDKLHTVTVNGNSIEKYRVVIAEDAPGKIHEAADAFVSQIKALTGFTLPIVTDKEEIGSYEILIGQSSRPLTTEGLDEAMTDGKAFSRYFAFVEGNTLVLSSVLAPNTVDCVQTFVSTYLFSGATIIPDSININEKYTFMKQSDTLKVYADWDDDNENAVFTSTDLGYFLEKQNNDSFVYSGGKLTADVKSPAITYLHFYAKDGSITADISVENADEGDLGVMLRMNADESWIRGGYDFEDGKWYIRSRLGADFFTETYAEAEASFEPGKTYSISLKVEGRDAVLTVDGKELLRAYEITHLSPGKPAIFADNVKLTVHSAKTELSHRNGSLFTDVSYTVLPYDKYIEGGQVYIMNDGSLIYQHHSGTTYRSYDNGRSWSESPLWTDSAGYVNIMRLNNGDFMKVMSRVENGKVYMYSLTSSDEGKSWQPGGNIAPHPYPGTNANATNMNDKLFQSPTTDRIFYIQNYETSSEPYMGKYYVFGIIYYSDDNGRSWTESETATFEMAGNEDHGYFGECKILECDDGTLRMYNSWNRYGCIVYSESKDNGKTWGPIVKMPEVECAMSSMQFNRDIYADNDTTYYMVWVNSKQMPENAAMTRSRLTLAKTTDGKNWEVLGDVWRWECEYRTSGHINQAVDPMVTVTKDRVIIGAGISEHLPKAGAGDHAFHQACRQHLWSVGKNSIVKAAELPSAPESLYGFTDVTTADSYYDAVKYAVDNGLFNGTSETEFSPHNCMTRGMLVTVLGRLDKADVSAYNVPTFADVKPGEWYTPYVEWAAAKGIVNGIGDGLYGVNEFVTVEQICTILYRHSGGKLSDKPAVKTLADFPGAVVSEWAKDAVVWALESGVYGGQGKALLADGAASRAVVAEMFANYVKVLEN